MLAALLLAAALVIGAIGMGSLPRIDGSYRLAGLDGPVAIGRDRYGVPRIEAASERDLYRAMGFVHAQDRLWQMAFQRRAGQGRLAEVLGEAALPIDRYMRTLGLYRVAEANLARLDARTLDLLNAYAQGVNDWLDRRDRLLPPEFWLLRDTPEPWTAADSAVWIKMMALTLDSSASGDLLRARLAKVLSPGQIDELWPAAAVPVQVGTGSNGWAVDGGHSATGAPILAGDPHLQLQTPGIWYLADLRAPGLQVVGATMPGLPFVVIGRTPSLAWTLTTTGADVQDLFVETVDPTDGDRYLTPDGPRAFETRDEIIQVRGGPTEHLVVRTTRHGPVVSAILPEVAAIETDGKVASLAWTALDPDDTTLAAGFAMARATDLAQAADALALYHSPVQNFIVASKDDGIGMFVAGAVPIRLSGDGTVPADGATGTGDWLGRIAPADLPRQVRPPRGRVVNANDRIVDDAYPRLITRYWEPAFRRERIEALLDQSGRPDGAAMQAIQRDIRSGLATALLPTLATAEVTGDRLQQLRAGMVDWDGTMAGDAWQPTLFLAWAERFSRLIRQDELGPLADGYEGLRGDFLVHAVQPPGRWCDDVRTAPVEGCASMAGRAFAEAVHDLDAALGADRSAWAFGLVQQAALPHAVLGGVPVLGRVFGQVAAKAGDGYSVDVAASRPAPDLIHRTVLHGPSLRMIADMSLPDSIRIVTAGGQSGHPWSRWFADGVIRWEHDTRIELPADRLPDRLDLLPGR